jgi:hypothetical protein
MKPTKAQVEARVTEILRIRLDGAEIWDVREYVREKEKEEGSVWQLPEGQKPLSDSQLWRYIAKADNAAHESCRASRKKLLHRHLAQRRNLYAKAVSQGDVRAALAVLDSAAKLQSLFPTVPKPTDEQHPASAGGDEESGAVLAALRAALDRRGGADRPPDGTGADGPASGAEAE